VSNVQYELLLFLQTPIYTDSIAAYSKVFTNTSALKVHLNPIT